MSDETSRADQLRGFRVEAGSLSALTLTLRHAVTEQEVTIVALPAAAPPNHWQATNAVIDRLTAAGARHLRERDELADDALHGTARRRQLRVQRFEAARGEILLSRGWVTDRNGLGNRDHAVHDVSTTEKLRRRRGVTGRLSTSSFAAGLLRALLDTAISDQPELVALPGIFHQLEATTSGACRRVEAIVAGVTTSDDDVVLAIEGAMVDHLEEHLVDEGYEVTTEAWRHIAWSRKKPRGGRTVPALGRIAAVPT